MRRGKREMYNGRGRKGKSALVALALVLCCTVGGTLAFLATQAGPVVNTFQPTQVSSYVDEDLTSEKGVKKNVKIQNTGDIDAYIRAHIVVNWADAAGNVYGSKAPVEGTDYTVDWNETNWVKGSDGYYYYTQRVNSKASTGVLIDSCKPVAGKAPDGYNLQVTILADAIQADGVDSTGKHAVETVWPVTVSGGVLTPN